jgi:hypothetical protein
MPIIAHIILLTDPVENSMGEGMHIEASHPRAPTNNFLPSEHLR